MGIIRIIINFLERLDGRAKTQPIPAKQKQGTATCVTHGRIDVAESINILFPNGDWFTNKQIQDVTGYSSSFVSGTLKKLIGEGVVAFNGRPAGSRYAAYRVVTPPAEPTCKCSKCGLLKKQSEFYAYSPKGNSQCKACKNKHQQAYRELKKAETAAKVIPPMEYKVDLKTGEIKIGKAN